jgi:hypothetical protein
MPFVFTFGTSFSFCGFVNAVGDWILLTGFWNDGGIWKDDAVWTD